MFGLKKRTWIIGGVVAALLGTAAYAARWHEHTPEERASWATERVADRLDLDDAQKQAFRKVADAYVEIRGARPEFMAMISGQLKELAGDDTLTVEQVNALRDQIKSEFDRRADAVIPEFVSFYNSLNDEQRGMVMARMEHMTERMQERGMRGHRRGDHDGGMRHHRWGDSDSE